MNKSEVVQSLLAGKASRRDIQLASAFSPANIALIKYWGKRDQQLNLPNTSSLSVSLADRGATITLSFAEKDSLILNGSPVELSDPVAKRLFEFLDLFRFEAGTYFSVDSKSNIPLAAGLASSASGFSALVKALDQLFSWGLSVKELSILARLGSGSACRSIEPGFCLWQKGFRSDGMDSYAEHLPFIWPELCIGLLVLSDQPKAVSSRIAMQQTVETSPLYERWPEIVEQDLLLLEGALQTKDFDVLGRVSESNAQAMHETMTSAVPPIDYALPETTLMMQKVWDARSDGLPVYFTQDAGPNLKLLFLSTYEEQVKTRFPMIDVIKPFSEKC